MKRKIKEQSFNKYNSREKGILVLAHMTALHSSIDYWYN